MPAEDKFELVVVGSGGVGKSSTTIRFLKDDFTSDYDPTVGAYFNESLMECTRFFSIMIFPCAEENYRKSVLVDSLACQLSIIDTAGQHEYEALRDQHLASGNGFLLVFALNQIESFNEIKQLRERIVMARNKKRLPMVVAANKCDLPEGERIIDADLAQSYFGQYKIPFFETSAKMNINVTEAFQELVRQCRKDANKSNTGLASQKIGAVKSSSIPLQGGKKCGCCLIM